MIILRPSAAFIDEKHRTRGTHSLKTNI